MLQKRYLFLVGFVVLCLMEIYAQKDNKKVVLPPPDRRRTEVFEEQRQEPQLTPEDKAKFTTYEAQKADIVNSRTFIFGETDFLKDKIPFQIVAFEFPYHILHKSIWKSRIQLIKSMGFNTLDVPVVWGFHETNLESIDFQSDEHDLAHLLSLAQGEGLYIVLQLGPHLSSNHPYRGMPWWISTQNLKFDGKDKKYDNFLNAYYKSLYHVVNRFEYQKGGNILLYRIDNQTGSCSNSNANLVKLKNLLIDIGFEPNFIATDIPKFVHKNSVFGVLPATENELSPTSIKDTVSKYNFDTGPFFTQLDMNSLKMDFKGFLAAFDDLLQQKISVSISNATFYKDSEWWLNPTNSKLRNNLEFFGESGMTNENFYKVKSILKKNNIGWHVQETPKPLTVLKTNIQLTTIQNLNTLLKTPVFGKKPKSHEELGQASGYVLYQTKLPKKSGASLLKMKDLHSKAVVYVNKKWAGNLDAQKGKDSVWLELKDTVNQLEVLTMNDISGNSCWSTATTSGIREVLLDTIALSNWQHYTIYNLATQGLKTNDLIQKNQPTLLSGKFSIKNVEDTYLDMRGWNQGVVWVNKKLLGYFEKSSSVQSLYIPSYFLKSGKNEIIIFEALWEGQTQIFSLGSPLYKND